MEGAQLGAHPHIQPRMGTEEQQDRGMEKGRITPNPREFASPKNFYPYSCSSFAPSTDCTSYTGALR